MSENTTSSFVERLANKTIAGLSSKIVFSEPIQKNGITVIPVSKIRFGYGFGGGYNTRRNVKGKKEGFGIGLGVFAQPIGFIKIKKDSVIFEPIHNPVSLPAIILTTGIAGFLLLRAATKLFR
jgi:uncharacterized spore protein YtfJ